MPTEKQVSLTDAVQTAYQALEQLSPEDQERVLVAVTALLGLPPSGAVRAVPSSVQPAQPEPPHTAAPRPKSLVELMQVRNDDEKSRVGNNLITVLSTDDCRGDMARLAANGVEIVEPVTEVPWGVSGVIRDLYGNCYNLVGAD